MNKDTQYLRSELVVLGLVLVSACLLSSIDWRGRRWFSWFKYSKGSIDNIYQLVAILQKNSRALFLIFNDLASAIHSVRLSHGEDARLTKEAIRTLLHQDWVQSRLKEVQDNVLQEFNIDQEILNEAITRYHNDDQVRMYTNGVELMYNIVIDGGYPHCPGVEVCEAVTKQFALAINQKVIEAKRNYLEANVHNHISTDSVEVNVVFQEMQQFGYTDPIRAYIAFKNTENIYQYDFEFLKSRQQLYEHVPKPEQTINLGPDIPFITREELKAMLDTMESDSTMFLLILENNNNLEEFVSTIKKMAKAVEKSSIAWMLRYDIAEYKCRSYPAAIRFLGGKQEEVIHHDEQPNGG